MESAVLAGRILLAIVFGVAAAAKLADRDGSRRALGEFGLPAALRGVGGAVLPLMELTVAAALVFPSSARWGAIGAIGLLFAFIAAIANALAHDRAPDCHCFGQIHSAPASWGMLARNGALAMVASFVVWRGPGPAIDSWVTARSTAELVVIAAAAAIAIASGWALSARSKRHAVADERRATADWWRERSGIEVGSLAPGFELPGVCDGDRTLESLRERGLPIVLLFTSSGCASCDDLARHVGRWQTTLANQLTIAVLATGDSERNQPLCEEYGIDDALLDDANLLRAYRMPGTPSAVVVAADGTIASVAVSGEEMIEELIRQALQRQQVGR